MTQGFVPAVRQLPPSVASSDIIIAAPPELAVSTGLLMRLLPVGMSIATVGVMVVAFLTGSGMTRNPNVLAFPMMMLVSVAVTAVAGRGQRKGRGVEASRVDYFGYLSRLRRTVTETASAQRYSLDWTHPDPDTLWTLIGGPRMWERRPNDWDFCLIRVGTGTQPLAQRLVAPEILTEERRDPITAVAVQRFIRAYSAIDGAPTTIGLRGIESLLVEGESDEVTSACHDLPTGCAASSGSVADRWGDQRPQPSPLGLAEVVAAQSASDCDRLGGACADDVSQSGTVTERGRGTGPAVPGGDRRPGRARRFRQRSSRHAHDSA